jgi:hypothetical protein
MRTREKNFRSRDRIPAAMQCLARAAMALLAIFALNPSVSAQHGGQGAAGAPAARSDAPSGGEDPTGLPPPNYPTSPYRGLIDGWTGKPIPCRCRFDGKSFELGSIVCMNTHFGTVLTRCDIVDNNTSWMPSRQTCTPDAGS